MAVTVICSGESKQRRVAVRRRFLHDPSFSAHGDAIAGDKVHACAMAMAVPWKNYP